MPNIQIVERQSTSVSLIWKEFGYAPLSTHLIFEGHEGQVIRLRPPNGSFPDVKQLEALSILQDTYPEWKEDVECNLVLCLRKNPFIPLGCLATIRGSIDSLVASLGWSACKPVVNKKTTITDQLATINNDYWVAELAAKALGLPDVIWTESPEISMLYPPFTFVIPARGVHDTIEQVILSIQAAVSRLNADVDWECIVVDDANEMPLAFIPNNHHIRVIRTNNQVHSGGARNLGLQSAKGDVIFFLDGDTMLHPLYIKEHLFRQMLTENLLTISMREYLDEYSPATENRTPDITKDTRVFATYSPNRIGLTKVNKTIDVKALEQTDYFRHFGFGRKIGPVDLPFMVKGNNLSVCKPVAEVRFPPDFIGYGPEDVTFAAKVISRGCMVLPVLSTGVFHINHPPRSGSTIKKDEELIANLERMKIHLSSSPWKEWEN